MKPKLSRNSREPLPSQIWTFFSTSSLAFVDPLINLQKMQVLITTAICATDIFWQLWNKNRNLCKILLFTVLLQQYSSRQIVWIWSYYFYVLITIKVFCYNYIEPLYLEFPLRIFKCLHHLKFFFLQIFFFYYLKKSFSFSKLNYRQYKHRIIISLMGRSRGY